jgi:hypothetical protein
MSTGIDKEIGASHGRLSSNGGYVFELGQAGGKTQERIAVGDYSRVYQSFSINSWELLGRATVTVIEPTDNSTVAWDIVGQVGAVEVYRRRLQPYGRSLTLTDIALSFYGAGPTATLRFILEAVTP